MCLCIIDSYFITCIIKTCLHIVYIVKNYLFCLYSLVHKCFGAVYLPFHPFYPCSPGWEERNMRKLHLGIAQKKGDQALAME